MKNKDFAYLMIALVIGAIILCMTGSDSPELW
jgi:hypothetical protein